MTRTWVGAQISRDHEQVSLKVQHQVGQLLIVLKRLSSDAQGGDGLVHVAADFDQQIILGDAATEEPAGRPIITGLGVDRARRFAHGCTWAATGALHGHGSWKNSSACRCPGRVPSPRAARAAAGAVRGPVRPRGVRCRGSWFRRRLRPGCPRARHPARAPARRGVLPRAVAVERSGRSPGAAVSEPASTIYTKTGDDGTTSRLFGGRVTKDDLLIEVCGDVDETVAADFDQQIILGDAAPEEPAGRPIVTGLGVDRARRFAHCCPWAATGALHGHGSWKNLSLCKCPGRAPSPRAARAQSATKPGAPATNTSWPHRSPNSAGSSPGNRPSGGSPACPVRVRTKRRPGYCRCQETKRSMFITSACVSCGP